MYSVISRSHSSITAEYASLRKMHLRRRLRTITAEAETQHRAEQVRKAAEAVSRLTAEMPLRLLTEETAMHRHRLKQLQHRQLP